MANDRGQACIDNIVKVCRYAWALREIGPGKFNAVVARSRGDNLIDRLARMHADTRAVNRLCNCSL